LPSAPHKIVRIFKPADLPHYRTGADSIDIENDFCATYELNNKPAKFANIDARKISAADITDLLGNVATDNLLFAGCAPCQPFSSQRKGGRTSDSTLLKEYGRVISEVKPGNIIMENVPGIARIMGNSTFRRFKRTLDTLGYKTAEGILDAKDYGVPQTRRRFVLIASKHFQPTLPLPTHGIGPNRVPYVTVHDAISQYPRIRAGQSHLEIANHRAASITELNMERLRHTPRNGGRRTAWPKRLRLACHNGYDGHTDVYGRMMWNKPAPTLTCKCYSISNGRYGHPTQNRAISLREAASLQTFPDSFLFSGISQASLGSQIGNAVPVLLAEALGRHVLTLSGART